MSNLRQSLSSCVAGLKRFNGDEQGASAVEYGLLASLIAAAIITVVGGLGGRLKNIFTDVQSRM